MREWRKVDGPNTYVVDPASGAEIARQLDLDALVNYAMGGLFPEGIDLEKVNYTLDVACGPGGWVQHAAFSNPAMYIVGIDIDQRITAYARAQARVQSLHNASFTVMDVIEPLPLPDASFDFINARFLNSFLPKAAWLNVMRELWRITRPSGWLCLIENDGYGSTNSQAFKVLEDLYQQAFSADPLGRYHDVVPLLGGFLREVGYQHKQEALHILDFSNGAHVHHSYYNNLRVGFKLLQPYMVEMGVATQETLDSLYERMLLDMLSSEFRGKWHLHSLCGQKPY